MSNVIVRSSFAFHGVMSTSSVVLGEHVSEMGPIGGLGCWQYTSRRHSRGDETGRSTVSFQVNAQ